MDGRLIRFGAGVLLALGAVATGDLGCAAQAESGGSGGSGESGEGGASTVGQGGGEGGSGGAACVPETEACDEVDNDCDGEVDEGCECLPGETQPCYTGDPGVRGVGECASGEQACGVAGQWGACTGDVLPGVEVCDGLDNDCDGQIDDDIAPIACGVGGCLVTVPGCAEGVVPSCLPGQPGAEVCDGVDNDCDQLVDETDPSIGVACDSGNAGICAAGAYQCLGGQLTCVPDNAAGGELCDGLDNDCDGVVDNNIPGTGGACSTGYPGVCGPGTISCQGSTIDCFPIIPPSAELCDGLDNDCDGLVDQGNPGGGAACDTGTPGVCAAGTVTCLAASLSCVPNALAAQETCNGIDDDCDGSIDENDPGGGAACGCAGTLHCVGGALVCTGGPTVYFQEDFSDNSAGWTLGTEWGIGPATVSSGHSSSCGNADPGADHTPTADNGVAGVVIGGNASTALHPFRYLESPTFDTSAAPAVYISYYRWLNSDYSPYMVNQVQVYDGSNWATLWQSGGSPGIADSSWTKVELNVTAYKSATMRVRFGFSIGSSLVYTCSQWNVDDVLVTSASCPGG
jgi:hypothetical protein